MAYNEDLERARRERSQGIKISGTPIREPRNRIEEALNHREISNSQFPILNKNPISNENSNIENSMKIKNWKIVNYRAFLTKVSLTLGILILIPVIAFGGYKVFKSLSLPKEMTSEQVIQAVGKLAILPPGENPTVATITDLAPLKNQPFFIGARIGDKVLIFSQSGKAILYRPSENKIITVAPINK